MESDFYYSYSENDYIYKEQEPFNPGLQLSHFEIEKQLGQNNYSSIYLVKCKLNNKKYAMKEIKTQIFYNEIQRLLIQKELYLLKNLNHPHITTYLSSFYEKGNFFIIIDYIEGEDLESYFKDKKEKGIYVKEKKIWEIFLQILDGLSYLHNTEKIIHRNIKPSNILIDKNGNIKITDYGISAFYKEENIIKPNLTTTSSVKYIKYTTPEIIEGGTYDYKSNIYMLD